MMALLHDKKNLILGLLLLAGLTARTQDTGGKPVTVHLKDTAYEVVLKELEKQSGYRFYYDTTDLDTVKISLDVDQQPLTKALDQLFAGTGMSYSFDRSQHLFITRGEAIATNLPG